jgi:hypothetical protein
MVMHTVMYVVMYVVMDVVMDIVVHLVMQMMKLVMMHVVMDTMQERSLKSADHPTQIGHARVWHALSSTSATTSHHFTQRHRKSETEPKSATSFLSSDFHSFNSQTLTFQHTK